MTQIFQAAAKFNLKVSSQHGLFVIKTCIICRLMVFYEQMITLNSQYSTFL